MRHTELSVFIYGRHKTLSNSSNPKPNQKGQAQIRGYVPTHKFEPIGILSACVPQGALSYDALLPIHSRSNYLRFSLCPTVTRYSPKRAPRDHSEITQSLIIFKSLSQKIDIKFGSFQSHKYHFFGCEG